MEDKVKQEKIQKLKEMIEDKEPDEKVEQVLVKLCARSGVSLDTCAREPNFIFWIIQNLENFQYQNLYLKSSERCF